jgi:tricorn protease
MRILFLLLFAMAAMAQVKLLPQRPALSSDKIVFSFAGDLWTVPRAGGAAMRLTSGPGVETNPVFSPDGSLIAFSGEYDGNVDVFTVPVSGGVPKRITWHPGQDEPTTFTPDGKHIVFRSGRIAHSRFRMLFQVSVAGGNPEALPFPMAVAGSYSPDGRQFAYMPIGYFRPPNSYDAWKNYRGGRTTKIWIGNMQDSAVVAVPRENSNDSDPMWVGNDVYFLSDRAGRTSLFRYNVSSKKVQPALPPGELDLKSASAGPGAIVLEQFGALKLFDLKSGRVSDVPLRIDADLLEVRPRWQDLSSEVRNGTISPTGKRAVLEARGEIISVPADKGDARNLTNSAGANDREPAWSPNGKWIAWISDASGETKLHLKEQLGGADKVVSLGTPAGYFFSPLWSPDSKHVALEDNRLNLWIVTIDDGKLTKVDTDYYYDPFRTMSPSWSPDSRWLAYAKELKSHMRAVMVHSLETGKSTQITDGMSDARFPRFDKDGVHLYFTASTDVGPTLGWIDMSSDPHSTTRSVYVAVLKNDAPSPLAPESDEEKVVEDKKPEEKKPEEKKATTRIDFDGISQRILSLPIPARNFVDMMAGKSGTLFLLEAGNLHRFDMKTKKLDKVMESVSGFDVSFDGEKLLLAQNSGWSIIPAMQPPKPGEGRLKLNTLQAWVDPRAEWMQMYRDAWRMQREYFYDPNLHGANAAALEKRYEPWAQSIASRADLNYLFQEMLGHLTVGHLYIRGGQVQNAKAVPVGLLGANFKVENGRYRFEKVLEGENWNPGLRAPLTQPGVNVKAGEYLLEVNGVNVTTDREVFAWLEATAGKATVLRVGADATGAGARNVTVVPLANEGELRLRDWVEANRKRVDEASQGRLAYVYLPDTGNGGFTFFNRYYFAQSGRDGVVVDERFNGGGQAADYIVDMLKRTPMNYWTTRYGNDTTTPVMAIFGPRVMIVNEFAGSGGDALPYYFRFHKVGPIVGTRTWGGLVGILGYPPLLDGGTITAPNFAFRNMKGEFDVENKGVAPDIEVEMDPRTVKEGKDPQLEKAIAVAMEALQKQGGAPKAGSPSFPVYNR